MTRPSSGVSPMVVSTHLPLCTAAMLHPLPRWMEIRLTRSTGFWRKRAVSWVMNLWEVPWNP